MTSPECGAAAKWRLGMVVGDKNSKQTSRTPSPSGCLALLFTVSLLLDNAPPKALSPDLKEFG
jgi:hypothetical protein